FGVVYGVVRSDALGWGSGEVIGAIIVGLVVLGLFVWWELRTPSPMLPMRFFRSRAFAVTNAASVAMYFGMFGSIFILTQFLQVAQHSTPLAGGIRMLAWTGVTMAVAPVAGIMSDRIGSRGIMATGLGLQAVALGWMASIATPTVAYSHLVPPFIIAGIGMG